jgi:DNA helicase-2/ATP-dependent DNA helicase PcrA
MMAMEGREGLEEERRLFYVAITRAEKRLFLSYALSRFKWGQYTDCKPSRFLEELNKTFTKQSEIALTQKKKNRNPYQIFAKTKTQKKKSNFIPKNLKRVSATNATVTPTKTEHLQVGLKVKHSRFGSGKILKIEGEDANKKAIIFFEAVGQKMLLLKFAKLEIEK